MLKLYHHPFSPESRFARLALGEYGIPFECQTEYPWARRHDFLMMNPAGTLPVLKENDGPAVCGPMVIMEYLDETRGYAIPNSRLLPDHPEARAETRRLVSWFCKNSSVRLLATSCKNAFTNRRCRIARVADSQTQAFFGLHGSIC